MVDAKKEEFSTLFVELDCLLDTRMGLLTKIGDHAMKAALDAGYHNRLIDSYKDIEFDTFDKLYADRDKTILQYSFMTPIGALIKDFAAKTLETTNSSPFHSKPRIILNIHPYVLEDDEIKNIMSAVKAVTLGLADVMIVDLPYSEITPLYCKINLSILILYRYDLWLEANSGDNGWKKHSCPEVTLLAPKMFFKVMKQHVSDIEIVFSDIENTVRPFINIHLLGSELFSMIIKLEKKT